MKHLNFIVALLISSFIVLFVGCEEDKEFEFGATQNNFVQDSTYLTNNDGLLLVQVRAANAMTELGAIIYAGGNENPTDTIGIIEPFGALTLPLKKNTYWKVTTYGNVGVLEKLIIEWTPIQ